MKPTLIAFFLSLFTLVNGQFAEPKFGKIEMSELSMPKYDKDTTAGALMLFDNGNTEFILSPENGFQFTFNRHCQIKLFKKSSFPVANVSIRLFKNNNRKEDLKSLKAITYNLSDGKIVKTKLDNDNIYRAEGKNYIDVKFAFPEIKEGSIIELSYSITSDFLYNLRGWDFQYSFPALWSQYTCVIPEYFEYRKASKGYLQFDVNKQDQGTKLFTIISEPDDNPVVGNNYHQARLNETIKAKTITTVLAIKDVPAFISEPNIDCEDNYIQSVEFELSSIQYPNAIRKDYTQSWESVNKQMKEDADFGSLLKANGFVKDTVAFVCRSRSTDIEKAISIYNYVQKRMKWNNDYRLWATKGLKKPFADAVGSSSEINLLLTMMLQTAGLKANPVMYSTRENGIANTYYPTITKFNSVLSSVEIDGKPILLDAVSKYCPFGVLPPNDVNGKGRVVNDLAGDWVDLDASEKYNEITNYNLTISPDGKLTGLITNNYDGYAGVYYRNAFSTEKSSDEYFKKLQENLKGLTINKSSVSGRNNNYKPVSDTLNVEITDQTELIGDKILFYPLLFEKIEKNRYTLEERKYPVNYNYPISEAYTFNYTLPAGYKVESMPQSVSLQLPDNSISVSFNIQNINNKLVIEYKRDINKMLFLAEDYAKLKNLYDQLVKKHKEQVILKKSI
jgi:hypothetical protein